ncbi:MAG: hypothetical protein HDS12_04800 [Bacteroides sp.]|nr:hypothetical protein [Bacteroidales bacterium]MBD5302551.1 hypothetical protein [Bacteroides sp.]MBD5206122.1 hypothetical protein [Bacteroidales bacterium]MBD5223571.1 hypothetical protein [Bacteroidales bacterium]MBD5305591.1 hypothetical protein [Bacteroides sp.]
MAIPVLKALLVIVILALMILVLLGINHIFSGNFTTDDSDIDDLRNDIIESDDVISEQNAFTELVKVKVPTGNAKK